MKNLKSKLMAAIAMLTVASVMMVSVSFAWFSISTAPEVKLKAAKVTSNGNLEIALLDDQGANPVASTTADTGKNLTWGNLVDLAASTDIEGVTLKPITHTDKLSDFKYPEYATDGRISGLKELNKEFFATTEGTQTLGVGKLTDTVYGDAGYYIDVALRTNVAGDISLSDVAARVSTETNVAGAGSTLTLSNATTATTALKESIKVAYRSLGTGATATETGDLFVLTPAVADGKLTGTIVSSAIPNTIYKYRFYVYMDGTNVTNADIPTTDNITATLNLQFAHSVIDLKPMDTTLVAPTPSNP